MHCEDINNIITSSVTRGLVGADEIVFPQVEVSRFCGGRGGRWGGVGEMGFFLVLVNCCKKLKSTEKQLIIV